MHRVEDDWTVVVANLAAVLQGHGLRDQPDLLREASETFVALAVSPATSGKHLASVLLIFCFLQALAISPAASGSLFTVSSSVSLTTSLPLSWLSWPRFHWHVCQSSKTVARLQLEQAAALPHRYHRRIGWLKDDRDSCPHLSACDRIATDEKMKLQGPACDQCGKRGN